ncbi:MAG: hypothetical protein H6578_12480, partial [Chitinophagales bacterium]|nr:hypothetical protein [Chitinophagales bacterium]
MLILFIFNNVLTFGQCTYTNSLATAYNQNNGQRGVMFDIVATNAVTINCLDANLYAGTTSTYEIYYKVGSFIGFENTSSAWTLIGTATNVTSLGTNIPTYIPININISIPSGQTYGFYVTNTSGGGISYTDGTLPNNNLANDPNITIEGGVGKSYPFGLTFSYRYFNGTIHYSVCMPVTASIIDTANCDSVNISGTWYTTNQTVNDTIVGGAANGCDSITPYNVIILFGDSTFSTATSCLPADTGYLTSSFTNVNGCDSTHTVYTSLLAS